MAGYKCWKDLEDTSDQERKLATKIIRFCNNANTLQQWKQYSETNEIYLNSPIDKKIELAELFFYDSKVYDISALETSTTVTLNWKVPNNIDCKSVLITSGFGSSILPKDINTIRYNRTLHGTTGFLFQTIDSKGNKSKGKRYVIYLNPIISRTTINTLFV